MHHPFVVYIAAMTYPISHYIIIVRATLEVCVYLYYDMLPAKIIVGRGIRHAGYCKPSTKRAGIQRPANDGWLPLFRCTGHGNRTPQL